MGSVTVTLEHRQKRINIIICAGLIAATLIAYEPIRHNSFITYDDDVYVTNNPQVTSGITWKSLGEAFTRPHFFMWHPLTTISHMLDCEIFALNPAGHHFTSLLLHILNALLLFWIMKNLSSSIWLSAFIAGVFALHPMQVESVAWAAERKTVISGLFWLLTMAAYIYYTKRPGFWRYLLVFAVYGLCIMTKPVVVTLPFALLLLDYWPLERIGKQKTPLNWLIIEKIPLLILSVILSVTTFMAQNKGGSVIALENIPLMSRIGNMFISYISYIRKIIWPSDLAVIYPYHSTSIRDANTIVCIILFSILTFLSVYIFRRRKYVAFGWLWFVGTLVPVIGLIQSGAQAMANRYMYIPMLGLLVITGWVIKEAIVNRPRIRIAATIAGMSALLSLLILTRLQVGHWQNTLTLFDYTLKATKNNYVAENCYGCALFDAGRVNEAMLHLNKSMAINPLFCDARCNIGKAFLKEGKLNEAISCFNEVLRQNKDFTDAHYNLAIALGRQKKYDEAIEHLAKVLQLNSTYPEAYNKIGLALQSADRPDEAIKYLNEGLKISKDREIYASLGSAYIQAGKYDLAAENLTKAIELKPDSVDALNKLAWLFAAVDNVSIHNAQKGIEFAQRGCELTGYNDPMLLDTLAVAYASAGRFDEAKATAEKALSIAKKKGLDNMAADIQNRIKLYQAGQPYLQK
jgi:protein O-mannosyl-transferase